MEGMPPILANVRRPRSRRGALRGTSGSGSRGGGSLRGFFSETDDFEIASSTRQCVALGPPADGAGRLAGLALGHNSTAWTP